MKQKLDESSVQSCLVHGDKAMLEEKAKQELVEQGYDVGRNYNQCTCRYVKNRTKNLTSQRHGDT